MKLLILGALFVIATILYQRVFNAGSALADNDMAPSFQLPDAYGKIHQLTDYSGKWLVLYFYPKDDTPGCTKEACHFRDDLVKLEKLGAKVVGVSVDSGKSHVEFAKKYNLPFPLLSDNDGLVANKYGALTNLGVTKIAKRYTYLIDPQGRIAKCYFTVDTSRHSQEIIDDLTKLIGK